MAKKYQEPYSPGWDKLGIEERIKNWLGANKPALGRREEDFGNFLRNFSASYSQLNARSWEELQFDLAREEEPSLEFWTEGQKMKVEEGVLAIYNTTRALLGLTELNAQRDSYKNN